MIETLTGRQMCETIVRSRLLKKPDGTQPTAKEIWEYSSMGELYKIPTWYIMALQLLEEPIPECIQKWLDVTSLLVKEGPDGDDGNNQPAN